MRHEAHRLFIDGVASPIVAERLDRHAGGATMEHSLPFLQIGTVVADDDGSTFTIRSVQLAMRDGVPRLVVGLDPENSMIRARAEVLAPSGTKADRGATLTFERPQLLAAREVIVSDNPPAPEEDELPSAPTSVAVAPVVPVADTEAPMQARSVINTRDLLRSAPPAVRDEREDAQPTFLVTKADRYGFAVERFLLEAWRHVREAFDGFGRVVDRLVSL